MNGRPNCRNKVAFLNSWVSVKSVYEELRFRDGLAWTQNTRNLLEIRNISMPFPQCSEKKIKGKFPARVSVRYRLFQKIIESNRQMRFFKMSQPIHEIYASVRF